MNEPTGRRCQDCGKPIEQNMKRTENDKHATCDPKGRIVRDY